MIFNPRKPESRGRLTLSKDIEHVYAGMRALRKLGVRTSNGIVVTLAHLRMSGRRFRLVIFAQNLRIRLTRGGNFIFREPVNVFYGVTVCVWEGEIKYMNASTMNPIVFLVK